MLSIAAAGCDESLSRRCRADAEPDADVLEHPARHLRGGGFERPPGVLACHNPNGGAFRQVGLDLSTAGSYDSLVGVRSAQKPGLLRVARRRSGEQLPAPQA